MKRPDIESIEWALGQFVQVRRLCEYIRYLESLAGESRHRLSITTEEWLGMRPCFCENSCVLAEALHEKWKPLADAYAKRKSYSNQTDFEYRTKPLVVWVTKSEVEECLDILKSRGARPIGLDYLKKLAAILEK